MKRFAAGLVAFAFAVSACAAGFDFRTTGTTTTEIFNFKPTPAVPPVSNPQWGKLFVPAAGVPGYSAGNFYISQNGGPWTLLSSFVGSGVVTTVFGRTGAISAVSGDYACAQVTGCMNQSGANTLTYSAGTPLRIKPSSAPAANTKEIDVQATGGGSTVFSVDYEGDVIANSLTLTSGTTGTGAYVLATSSDDLIAHDHHADYHDSYDRVFRERDAHSPKCSRRRNARHCGDRDGYSRCRARRYGNDDVDRHRIERAVCVTSLHRHADGSHGNARHQHDAACDDSIRCECSRGERQLVQPDNR
jgi:hypothetical protein